MIKTEIEFQVNGWNAFCLNFFYILHLKIRWTLDLFKLDTATMTRFGLIEMAGRILRY